MVASTDDDDSRSGLLLKMALEAKRMVSLHQHLLIH